MKERLFALKKTEEKDCEESAVRFQLESEINYQQEGFREAGRHDGSVTSLRICLQKIYRTSIDRISRDVEEQEKRKRGLREKVEDRKGENVQLSSDSEEISSKKIPALREKIGRLKEELSYIRQNPHEIIGDEAGRAGFFIGCIILLFLTVYLFVFYSSATYSTFFKEFTLNEIGVASSIFDPDALTLAYEQGVTELILLLTIPFIFLGLGYLIHEFKKKYFRIALLILVTFIFDAILGYEITAKIYNITRENSFETLPEYTIPMA
ncbi:MAG: hypothetical protein LBK07_09855, partial [Tannerella sp.]|nr:hypothetical protein [Tannerella sp.]